MPSAIVEAGGSVTRSRASSARFIAGSVSACTPITRTSGRWDLIARPTPPTSPPPPTGTRTASMSGRCASRSEEHTSELQSRLHLVCRLLLEKKKKKDENKRMMKDKQQQEHHVIM